MAFYGHSCQRHPFNPDLPSPNKYQTQLLSSSLLVFSLCDLPSQHQGIWRPDYCIRRDQLWCWTGTPETQGNFSQTFKNNIFCLKKSVVRIWIRRIHMFLGLPYPDLDPLDRDTDPDPSSSKNSKKNIDFYCFLTSLWLFIFKKWCKCTFKVSSKKT